MTNASLVRAALLIAPVAAAFSTGCGVLTVERPTFPDQVRGTDGEALFIDDLLDILSDDDLSDAEKADALRALGFENEEVIDAIVRDGLENTFDGVADDDDDGN